MYRECVALSTENRRKFGDGPLWKSVFGFGRSIILCQDGGVHSEPYFRGISLFNRAEFFECHEVLEEVWRHAPEPDRKFLQALIQTAVALHHYSKGNSTGARALFARALLNLANYPEEFGGLALPPLRQSIVLWQEALDRGTATPPLPTFRPGIVAKK
jgi:hypothetical protein